MLTKQTERHFHIFNYFLDGEFLRWQEVQGNSPVCGQYWVVDLKDNTQIVAKVVEIEPLSETESKIMLSSDR